MVSDMQLLSETKITAIWSIHILWICEAICENSTEIGRCSANLTKIEIKIQHFSMRSAEYNGHFPISVHKGSRKSTKIYSGGPCINSSIITRQNILIPQSRPRTSFSSKLPKHNFTRIWNKTGSTLAHFKKRLTFKRLLKNSYLEAYRSQIKCFNPRCTDCCDYI